MIIREKGLQEGRRLRRCTPRARLFWPWLYSLSNGYVRLELDFELLSERLISFKEDAPTAEDLEKWFRNDYEKNGLVFIYETNGQLWGQWDTPAKDTKEYKTAADRESPAPPEEDYLRWLCERHGAQWMDYHWDQRELAKGLPDDFAKIYEKVCKDFPIGIGKGKGLGSGYGYGHGHGQSISISPSVNSPSATDSQTEMNSNNSPSNLRNITLQSNPVPSEEADISPEQAITDMVSRYPRPCPMGKRGEWFEIFQSNIISLAHDLFDGEVSPAITLVNRILNGFIKRSAEQQSSRILGPEKFFEKWVSADFGLQRLRQRAAQRKESDYGD